MARIRHVRIMCGPQEYKVARVRQMRDYDQCACVGKIDGYENKGTNHDSVAPIPNAATRLSDYYT